MKSIIVFAWIGCLYTPLAPGLDGCPPPDAAGWGAGATPANVAPAQPRIIWADRWGALAIDDGTGQAGYIGGFASKAKARRAAMDGCEMHGSPNCKLIMTYHNQCAAVASGADKSQAYGAATEEEAKKGAMESCMKRQKNARSFIANAACPRG